MIQSICCFFLNRYSIDYDVTAFVNGETPPFDDVLDDFQNVILANFDVKEENMKVTARSVGFVLDDIDFDLLPATNLANRDVEGLYFLVELMSKIGNAQENSLTQKERQKHYVVKTINKNAFQ